MVRVLLRGMGMLSPIMASLVIGWAGLTRAAQPPMPPVLYSKNLALYLTQVGCSSLLDHCSAEGTNVLEGLYTIPVASWSPDGNFIAVHLFDHWAIYPASCLPDLADCKAMPLDTYINDARLTWGPDGSLVAYIDSTGSQLTLMTRGCWDGGPSSACLRRDVPISAVSGIVGQQDWSADGSVMAFVDRQLNGFVILDLACLDDPAGCVNGFHYLPAPYYPVAWSSLSADGTKLLYHADTSGQGYHEALFLMDTHTGEAHAITHRDGASLYPDWSSDERYIVFNGYASARGLELNLYVMDYERGLTILLLSEPGHNLNLPAWGVVR